MNLEKAAHIIRHSGLVAFPTETVYGLGCNAFDSKAAAKIFEVKNRPKFDPLIVHISSESQLKDLVLEISDTTKKLMTAFWPGPLTLIFKKKKTLPPIITSDLDTVAIRMPNHPIALKLISKAKIPIAAPSANPFGYISPTTAQHVKEQIGNKIDLILDGGPCQVGIESTIIDATTPKLKVLRWGGLDIETIEKTIGQSIEDKTHSKAHPSAPGQLTSHYAPHKPLLLFETHDIEFRKRIEKQYKNIRFLLFKPDKNFPKNQCEILSQKGNLIESAANLFSALHKLDASEADLILAETIPEIGLGRAIMDKLKKAEHKKGL